MGESRAPNLSAAMLAAQTERRTGVFTVRVEQVETHVYFTAGSVVSVEQGALSDTLGRVLVREGKLTGDQYEVALKRMMRGQAASETMRFGEILVELGFLTGPEVCEALAEQVRQKTIRCLSYPEPQWRFEERPHKAGQFPSRVGRLILAAASRFEPDRIHDILDLEHARYPRLVSDAASVGLLFEMNGAEQGILSHVDGAKTTQDLIAVAAKASGRDDVCAVLAAIVHTGVAELAVEPVRLRDATRLASAEPSAQPSPPAVGHVPIGAIALKRSAKAASTVLAPVDAAAKAPPDPRQARLTAEEAFQKGRRLLDRGQADRALVEFNRAVGLCPSSTEFGVAREWAEFLATANDETRSAKLSALKRLASEAVKQDPSFAFGFLVLGRVASLEGLGRPGVRFFRQALKLDPSMTEAERYLRLLTARASRPESSADLTAAKRPVVAEVRASNPEAAAPPPETRQLQEAPTAKEGTLKKQAPSLQGPFPSQPRPRRARAVGLVALLFVASMLAAGLVVRQRRPWHPSARTAVAASVASVPPTAPRAVAGSVATHAPRPPIQPTPSATSLAGPTQGTVKPPLNSRGHRLFVDGLVVGETPNSALVSCGSHIIKVGRHGREQLINVPCGGAVDIEP